MLMHVLSIGESTLQVGSNCLCNYKARHRVDNDSVKSIVSPPYVPSMNGLKSVFIAVRNLNIGTSEWC